MVRWWRIHVDRVQFAGRVIRRVVIMKNVRPRHVRDTTRSRVSAVRRAYEQCLDAFVLFRLPLTTHPCVQYSSREHCRDRIRDQSVTRIVPSAHTRVVMEESQVGPTYISSRVRTPHNAIPHVRTIHFRLDRFQAITGCSALEIRGFRIFRLSRCRTTSRSMALDGRGCTERETSTDSEPKTRDHWFGWGILFFF